MTPSNNLASIESAHNIGVLAQALGHVRGLGNPSDVVYLHEYHVQGTFDDRSVWRNIEKAIPEAMAQLNLAIFNGDDEGEGLIDIGSWVVVKHKAYSLAGTDR